MKKITAIILIILLTTPVYAKEIILNINSNRAMVASEIKFINNQDLTVTPIIADGVTMIPLRFLAESLNFTIIWENSSQSMQISTVDKIITLKIDNNEAIVEEKGAVKKIDLAKPPMLINDYTYVPLRDIATILGKYIFWEESGFIAINDFSASYGYSEINSLKYKLFNQNSNISNFPKLQVIPATNYFGTEIAKHFLNINISYSNDIIGISKPYNIYYDLINGQCDVILSTKPTKEELDYAKKMYTDIELIPIFKDAFVFYNNKDNTVNNITAKNLKNIYRGNIINWNVLGGLSNTIIPYQQPLNSYTQNFMKSKFMNGISLAYPPTNVVINEDGSRLERVTQYTNRDGALGYSFLFDLKKSKNIKIISIDGVIPTQETISNNSYPYYEEYYIAYKKQDYEKIKPFLEYLQSYNTKKIINDLGYFN